MICCKFLEVAGLLFFSQNPKNNNKTIPDAERSCIVLIPVMDSFIHNLSLNSINFIILYKEKALRAVPLNATNAVFSRFSHIVIRLSINTHFNT